MSRWITRVGMMLRSVFRRKRIEQDLAEELRYHLERQIEEELNSGVTQAEARHAAIRAMGPMTKSIEECRDVSRFKWIDDLAWDLKYAGRALRRNPGFAAVVVTISAIAIGAVTTVFSIVDAWLLKPLNFPNAGRLAIAFAAVHDRPAEPAVWLPYRIYMGWKERSRSFESISAAFLRDVTLTTAVDAQSTLGLDVTPEFFQTFGVQAFLGRHFSQQDFTGSHAVVLSYGLWLRQFGGSPDVIGKTVTLSSVPYEIVGVMPQHFETRVLDMRFDFWTPLIPGEHGYTRDGMGPVTVVGRLRHGVSIDSARSELVAISREIESAYADNFNQFVVNLTSLQADNTRTVRVTLLTILAAVLSLLLIASMNVGALLLGRGLARLREAAIRTAIGSGRARLIRQLLAESLLIAMIGGISGLGIAVTAMRLFVMWNPLGSLPPNVIRVDVRVLAATVLATAVTTIACGLIPALRIAKACPYDALRAGERAFSTTPGHRAQVVLLVAQMSTCVILLIVTTLLIRTFFRLESEPLGFDAANLSVANVVLPNEPFGSSEKRNIFYSQLAERVSALPGIRGVAAGTSLPLNSGPPSTVNTTAENSVDAPRMSAQEVTKEFFDTLNIPLLAGRAFDARDSQNGAAVVILNTRAAEQLFGSRKDALGQRVRLGNGPWREIVGVVGNVRSTFFNTLEWQVNPIVYRPASQAFSNVSDPTASIFEFKLHIRSDHPLAMADLRAAAAGINANAAVTELRPASEMVKQATRQPAFRMMLLLGFAAISLLLAAVGVYALVAQSVTQRRREIAIRLSLGARPLEVIAAVSRRALTATLTGFGLGILAAFMLAHFMETLLYGVRPHDAASLTTAAVVLLGAATIAAIIPGMRALRVDPAKALRAD